MIDYLIIRDWENAVAIVDDATSIIWNPLYYDVGEFEIYLPFEAKLNDYLVCGNFVTRPDTDDVGIIEHVEIDRENDSKMICAGRFAKAQLERRVIAQVSDSARSPIVISGNVETAVRSLVYPYTSNPDDPRYLPHLELGNSSFLTATMPTTEVGPENLLKYTDELLRQYGYGAKVILEDGVYKYVVYAGCSKNVIFSPEFDNLPSASYVEDEAGWSTTAYISGDGDEPKIYAVYGNELGGPNRREIYVDGSSIHRNLKVSDLAVEYPYGTWSGIVFKSNGQNIARLVVDKEKEYKTADLQEAFPTGTVTSGAFKVNGVVYGRLIYGETDKWTLTDLGYKAYLEAEGTFEDSECTLEKAIYISRLQQLGKESLTPMTKSFTGEIDVNGQWKYGADFSLGDLVTVADLGQYVTCRIIGVAERQDENGYNVSVAYEY